MRDFFSWSFPILRVSGIVVRVHLLYILFALGVILRVAQKAPEFWVDATLLVLGVLFISVLLHEFGHAAMARGSGGSCDRIMMWPLGGLAYVDLPAVPRAHFWTAFAGPMVNLTLAVASGAALVAAGYSPPLNPAKIVSTLDPELTSWRDGSLAIGPKGAVRLVKPGTQTRLDGDVFKDPSGQWYALRERKFEKAEEVPTKTLSAGVVWVARIFIVNWFLFVFNLIPAFPLDGGQMLLSVLWKRGDLRSATTAAVYTGLIFSLIFLVVAMGANEFMIGGLAFFMAISCYQRWAQQEMGGDDAAFGYDFSQGYTSLEQSDPPAPVKRRPRQSWFKRWMTARNARRIHREELQQLDDDKRMDDLLDKVHRQGKDSLSDEERRFMARVSDRYRNKP